MELFSPPPPIYRKEIDNLFIIFCVHFQKLFVEFVVLLTKIWPKNFDFCRYSENFGNFRGLILLPPLSSQVMTDAIKLFFYSYLF